MIAQPLGGPREQLCTVALASGPLPADRIGVAEDALLHSPGLGAVVLCAEDGKPIALVTYSKLVSNGLEPPAAPDEAWLQRVVKALTVKSYVVRKDTGGSYPPAVTERPASAVRVTVRRVRAALRMSRRERLAQRRRERNRNAFIRDLRREARAFGADLQLAIAPDAVIEPNIRIQMRPGRTRIEIGSRSILRTGVVLRLGGELIIGRGVELRHDVLLNVKGRLELRGRNTLGRGSMIHADGHMIWEFGACVAEYVTVLDTHHTHDGTLVQLLDQPVEVHDVFMGAGGFVGAKSSVMPGVRIGRACFVGANSVITHDIPDGWIAVGSPAKPVRPLAVEHR